MMKNAKATASMWRMREKRDFKLERKGKTLTPERLMRILNQTEGGERAKQAYKRLTGLNPPPDENEIVLDGR